MAAAHLVIRTPVCLLNCLQTCSKNNKSADTDVQIRKQAHQRQKSDEKLQMYNHAVSKSPKFALLACVMQKLSMQNQSYKFSVAATNRSDLVSILYMCSYQSISMLLVRCFRVLIIFELTSQDHKEGTAQYISRRDPISSGKK